MLESIKIINLALIDKSVINFNDGFNVLTGETGAGKSLIVDALLFLTGIRADKTLIKSGEEFAKVEGVFSVDRDFSELNEVLSSVDIENEGTLIISRHFSLNGKNECRINGEIVTLNILRKVSNYLIDIFGQNDSQALLNPANHLSLMDDILSDKLSKQKIFLSNELFHLQDVNENIKLLGGLDKDRENTIELLQFQIKEIDESNLYDGKEEEIKQKIDRMVNCEKIFSSVNNSTEILDGEYSISNAIKQAINSLTGISDYDSDIKSDVERLYSIKYELDDVVSSLSSKKNNIEYNEEELDKLQDDLTLIKDLERKYGNTIADILITKERLIERLDNLLHSEEKLELLRSEKEKTLDNIFSICLTLHNIRQKEFSIFRDKMILELRELGMKNANFEIVFTNEFSRENIEKVVSESGADEIEFMFSANLGVEVRPLTKIISGGEMSRFMLGFKCLQNSSLNKTCIFDEIDTGIGGEVGVVIGKKICKISKNNQVICITHLSQIASFGDTNFLIQKYEEDGKTITNVKMLDENSKVQELARMIGNSSMQSSISFAENIIMEANEYKKNI
ncbi:MAG: DNA repair protein RecN [Clostridiales bacterium]|nr:DNA repair protein RecN [Clostridiales bacterium]